MHITHVESTACEEYELVKNTFDQIIKEYKREKELYLAAISAVAAAAAASITTTSSSSTEQPSKMNSLISMKTKERGSEKDKTTTQRGKSPKSTFNHTIMQEISPVNMSIINVNSPSFQHSSSHHQLTSSSSSSSGAALAGASTPPTSSSTIGLVGSTSALINTVTNNMSSGSLSRIIGGDIGGGGGGIGGGGGGGGESTTNSESGGTPPSVSNISNVVSPSSASIKKNSSKFPFLTKILNKNN